VTRSTLIAYLMLGSLVAVPVGVLIYKSGQPSTAVPKEKSAELACRDFILKQAHDPSRTEFPKDMYGSIQLQDGTWSVIREVRAPNEYNALRLFRVECKLYDKGDKWQLVSLQEVGQ
jgi:hypothetical protein